MSSRRLARLAALLVTLSACGGAPPVAVPESPSDLLGPFGPAAAPGAPAPASPPPAAAAPPAPPAPLDAPPPGPAVDVVGAWKWDDGTKVDIVVYDRSGRGRYYRDGAVCYVFSWFVTASGVLGIRADADSGCQGRRENDYRVRREGAQLVLEHIGSGYRSRWYPTVEPPSAPPPPQTPALAARLVGRWKWGGDVVTYGAGGRGRYDRDGSLCYEFSWSVEGDVLQIRADQDSGCQGRRDNDYRVTVEGDRLTKVHVGSSFETEWVRLP
ncbi:MAG: hypothetical protein IT376_02720 [Polyangiaceae bacterium]|nr:hypothetical protein [Polyangiaceae bacterium]